MSTDKGKLIELLEKLVKYPTETGAETATNKCFEYLSMYLNQRGMAVTELVSSGFPVLMASTTASKQPKVLLQSHIDVVPAHEVQYVMQRRDGRLYGRGTFDMKFAAACYLMLIDELQTELQEYDFGIMFTSDEEIANGSVQDMLSQGFYEGTEVCILPDAGLNWEIEASCNGAWFMELTANGHTAHGSRPWEGDNAIDRLFECLTQIKAIFGDPKPEHSSLNIGQIEGGTVANQVPAEAKAVLDMRFKDMDDYSVKRPQVESIANKLGLSIRTLASAPPIRIDLTNPYVKTFIDMARDISGREIKPCHSLGSSDAHHFVERGIPTILMRPEGGGPHSDNEWVKEDDFIRYYELIKAYVTEVASVA